MFGILIECNNFVWNAACSQSISFSLFAIFSLSSSLRDFISTNEFQAKLNSGFIDHVHEICNNQSISKKAVNLLEQQKKFDITLTCMKKDASL